MNNYPPGSTTENPYEALALIEAQGYPSVVAVNSELEFDRYVREGESLYYTTRLEAISEEKKTGLGTGFFVTLVMTYFARQEAGDEQVGKLLFRVFKFYAPAVAAPADAAPAPAEKPKAKRPQPGISDDTRFFWEGRAPGQAADPALHRLPDLAPSARAGVSELPFVRMGRARSLRPRHGVFVRRHALSRGGAVRPSESDRADRTGGRHAPGRPADRDRTWRASRSGSRCKSNSIRLTTTWRCRNSGRWRREGAIMNFQFSEDQRAFADIRASAVCRLLRRRAAAQFRRLRRGRSWTTCGSSASPPDCTPSSCPKRTAAWNWA